MAKYEARLILHELTQTSKSKELDSLHEELYSCQAAQKTPYELFGWLLNANLYSKEDN